MNQASDPAAAGHDTRYAREVSPGSDDSLSLLAQRIPAGSTVLDVGTGPGALGAYLSARGCTVDGIERDPAQALQARPHYRRLLELDLESDALPGALGPERYDVVVCADVLEHVRDPGRVLDAVAGVLRPGGRLLVSVPNVGYAGLVAALAAGDFRYRPIGLLDATHVRFFTRRTLLALLAEHGLGALWLGAVTRPLHESEFRDAAPEALPAPLRDAILSQPDATVYQFLVEAIPGAAPAPDLTLPRAALTFGARVYWRSGDERYAEVRSSGAAGELGVSGQTLSFPLTALSVVPDVLRLDPADRPGFVRVRAVRLLDRGAVTRWEWSGEALSLARAPLASDLVEFAVGDRRWWVATGDDPQVVLPIPPDALRHASGGTVVVELDAPMSFDGWSTARVVAEHTRGWDAQLARLEAGMAAQAASASAQAAKAAEQAATISAQATAIAALERRVAELAFTTRALQERVEDAAVTPSRRLAMSARRAVAPRRFELRPVPVSGVSGAAQDWQSLGFGTMFHLDRSTNRYPGGWVEVDLELAPEDGEPVTPILRARTGEGEPEVSVVLPPVAKGSSRGIVKLPDRVRDLHLSPIDRPVRFRMGTLRVRELSRPLAALRLAAPLVPGYVLRPGRAARAAAQGVALWRTDGWGALKRRFRSSVTAGAHSLPGTSSLPAPIGPRVAFLAVRMMKGYGVEVVVAQQVEHLCARGYDVTVLVLGQDGHYDDVLRSYVAAGCLRVITVASVEHAVAEVRRRRIRVVIAETPPFYEALALLPDDVVRILFDHGEPPPELFPDADVRRRIDARKVEVSRNVDLAIAISRFVQADSGLARAEVCFNGNDHLLRRRSNLARLPGRFRERVGLADAFVVLNVTRFGPVERCYKGLDVYAAVREALVRRRSDLGEHVRFVVAGRSDPADRAWAESRGLVVASNLDDDELVAAYLDADLYLTTSQWEGYNLGLAQALALGVPSLASARGAHPEFPVRTSDDPDQLAAWISDQVDGWRAAPTRTSPLRRLRGATVYPWVAAAHRLEELVRGAVEAHGGIEPPVPPPLERAGRDGEAPVLSILILNKDRPELIEPCVRSIEEHCDVPYEILIGDTGSTDPRTLRFYETTPHATHYLGFYGFSAGNNVLAARARGRHLLFLNNDTKLIRTSFRDVLAYVDQEPSVGCVGAYLVYPDRTIQHAGVRLCRAPPQYRGIGEHIDRHRPLEGYPWLAAPRDVVGVTGAMLLVSAQRFAQAGGFDEVYVEEAQDIDLCLRLREAGLRSVVHPSLLAFHYENSTRTVKEDPRDRTEFLRRFGPMFERELWAWQDRQGL